VSNVEQLRKELEQSLNQLCQDIGLIRIGHADQFPFGWRKAAKGRTVWRIVEEIISQNLENNRERYNLDTLFAAESEVGVYDFYGTLKSSQQRFYVNVKSAVNGAKVSKDDISKADKLLHFLKESNDELFIATFVIEFNDDLSIRLNKCIVMPITWVPDVYVNPSNNGNLQSSKCKSPETWIQRSREEFIDVLQEEMNVARRKKMK
jgi:frataxin-like iron-binding protein CyaY